MRQVNECRPFPFFCKMKKKKKRGTVVKVNYRDREYNDNAHTCIELERRSPEQVYMC
jgi:hypothetical protein